jgi:hypothetical protein
MSYSWQFQSFALLFLSSFRCHKFSLYFVNVILVRSTEMEEITYEEA